MSSSGLAGKVEHTVVEQQRSSLNHSDAYEMWVDAGEENFNPAVLKSALHRKHEETSAPLGIDEYFYTSL